MRIIPVKTLMRLAEFAAIYGAKGLAWLKVEEDGVKGPIAKFFAEDQKQLYLHWKLKWAI